jgi:ATP-dependent Clp protease adaptor protein ClpS
MSGTDQQTGEIVEERVVPKKDEPTLYKVILLNDDYSTMDFVIHVLEDVFQTKVETVSAMAKKAGFPLRAVTEDV